MIIIIRGCWRHTGNEQEDLSGIGPGKPSRCDISYSALMPAGGARLSSLGLVRNQKLRSVLHFRGRRCCRTSHSSTGQPARSQTAKITALQELFLCKSKVALRFNTVLVGSSLILGQ